MQHLWPLDVVTHPTATTEAQQGAASLQSENQIDKQEQSMDNQQEQICKRSDALSRMPLELRSVQQAMKKCGCEDLPLALVVDSDALPEDRARHILRTVWRFVLQLPDAPSAAEALQEDNIPFASCGGDFAKS